MKKTFALLILLIFAFASQMQAKSGVNLAKKTFKETNKEKRFEIEVSYPQITEANSPAHTKFNEVVKKFVMDDVQKFKEPMLKLTAEDLKFLSEGMSNYLELGYEIEFANEEFISVNFGHSEYTGGAHPNHWTLVFNYDLKNNKKIELSDLFEPKSNYLKIISDYSIADLKKQMSEDPDSKWILEGAGAKKENFANWNFTKEGLKFTFDPYQVAPYSAGTSSVIVPYEKFPLAVINGTFNSIAEISFVDGSPPNWCRGGRWTVPDIDFKIAEVKGKSGERAYFYGDDDDCPNGESCRKKSYMIAGDKLIVGRTYGNWACGWYQPKKGNETVGWIALDKIDVPKHRIQNTNRLGEWRFAQNDIKISRMKDGGKISIKGNAIWQGSGDNVHIGEIDFTRIPKNSKLNLSDGEDEYACRVKMELVGEFLLVSDNSNCGGVNVSFNGVYQRK